MAFPSWKGGTGSQAWSATGNWTTGAAPVAADSPRVLVGTSNINSGLDQHTLASGVDLVFESGFTGQIGADDGGTATDALWIPVTRLFVTKGYVNGAFVDGGMTRGRFKLVGAAKVIVQATGSPVDAGRGAVQLSGMDNTSEVDVQGGSVSIAAKPGDTATVNKVKVSGGVCILGEGTTVSGTGNGVWQDDGEVLIDGLAATLASLTQYGGTLNSRGIAYIQTVSVNGETHLGHRAASGNDCDTITVENGGQLFLDDDPRQFKTLNPIKLYRGAFLQLFDKSQLVTNGGSGQIQLVGCGPGDVTIICGQDLTLTVT
jgi:hypothetical protein